jgi:hypothetical protein
MGSLTKRTIAQRIADGLVKKSRPGRIQRTLTEQLNIARTEKSTSVPHRRNRGVNSARKFVNPNG